MPKAKSSTSSGGSDGGVTPAAFNLMAQVLAPVFEAFQQLARDIKQKEPTEIFARYIDVYLSLYAAGRLGDVMIEQLGLEASIREAALQAMRETVDHQVEKFAELLTGGTRG